MKKNDLENGYIVECKNGQRYIVIKDFTLKTKRFCGSKDIMLSNSGFMDFNNYNDDLTDKNENTEWNIDKVYYRKYLADTELKLLWERKIIRLTDDERKLLEVAYNQGYNYIARDGNNTLFIFKEKPTKEDRIWILNKGYWLETFEDMFDFIKWEDEKPYAIEELLKEC